MNVSLSALFRVTGPLLTAALSISAPLIAHAQDNGHYVLEKAVQVSRHGVRPQTDTQKLVDATQRQWPTWLVRDGELTGHGYLAASLMGAWQAGHYRQAGLLPAGCPDNTTVYTLSSPKQRTRATAAALLDGMFPGCGQKALASAEKLDPLFQTDKMDFARIDPVIAKGEILKAVGGDLQAAKARLQPDLDLLKAAACVEGKPCPFYEAEWVLKQNDEGRLKIKGLDKASSLGETFRLQYSEGKPLSEVAFGHAADARQVMALTRLHRAKYDFVNDTPHIAKRGGSQLMNQLLLALEQGTALEKTDPLGNPPKAPLLVIVAHDTNLSHLRTMLGFHWALGEYQPGNIPPTGTLAFERYRDANSGERFIRTTFLTQSPDQIRNLTPLTGNNVPLQVDFEQPGCKKTAVGTLCPLESFASTLSKAIDRTAMTTARYP